MTPVHLHEKLIEACENGNLEDVKHYLDAGADPNFNLQRQTNALDRAIEIDNHQIINLLLNRGAIVKELVLQKAIEKDKNYLKLLIPDFSACEEKALLMGVLQAAIKIGNFDLTKQAIDQGAKPEFLFLSTIRELNDTQILQLLLENGMNLHTEKNKLITEWMGSSIIGSWRNSKPPKHQLLSFIADYYLERLNELEKFSTLPDKTLLFRLGLDTNNFNVMKFAFLIGANKNEALNSTLYRYYSAKNETNQDKSTTYKIIEYMLNGDIEFEPITISNAVFFKYTELLNALKTTQNLEYGYEMAYNYENDDLCEYFINRGVSKKAQNFAKMKISATKGDIKELRKAVKEGADLKELDKEIIIEIIEKNHIEILKYLNDSGVLLDSSFNESLDKAMNQHNAYKSISYLIEQGLDITKIKNIPREYKEKYPIMADMWEKSFKDIFDYTIYLATQIHPNVEGKEKEEVLKKIAELSSLSYVIKRSEERTLG